jgi:FkbM family methyltransferase
MNKRTSKRNLGKIKQRETRTDLKNPVHKRLDTLGNRIAINPSDSSAWKELANICLQQNELEAALTPSRRAAELLPDDPEVLSMQGAAEYNAGNIETAIKLFRKVIKIDPKNPRPHHDLATIFHRRGEHTLALQEVEKGLELDPENMRLLDIKGACLRASHRLDESYAVYKKLVDQHPHIFTLWIDIGNLHHDLGNIEEALHCYEKAKSLSGDDATAYSNHLTSLHYHPDKTRDEIFQACLEWEQFYAPSKTLPPPLPKDLRLSKPLRIGMISDGFRKNPVGLMITSALENLPKSHYEFYAYTSNNVIDPITIRLQKICTKWIPITQTYGERLRENIIQDEIDILIDLAGHHKGSRMSTLAMKPAPIIIKWVGGLINTTGVKSFDYLLSDKIETPESVDAYYIEKLIRMPDDYICYDPPEYAPNVTNLPALSNGYVTFGCFNNPLKINKTLAKEWAELLNAIPESKLFLKSFQYNSTSLCDIIAGWMQENGIHRSRLIFEGSSPHFELLEAYNRVDIALDPWPYSGGLTTCEALLMGVPVVTMPGPTFAGRHSATHLINAGLPELVTDSWDEYRARVIELVSDIDSLATIRTHLRTILLQSKLCDPKTFSGHLDNALRAIWQRYCEGKQPEALNFNEQGDVIFADEAEPMQLQHPNITEPEDSSDFKWEFQGKVIAIDHGGHLMDMPDVKQMLDFGTLELIEFDPASNYLKHPMNQHSSVQCYPNIALGDGHPATLYACQAPEQSGTLKPAPREYMPYKLQQDLNVLAELPIGTVALDKVSELPSVDWLVLDDLNDAALILQHGENTLKNTLLIHVKLAFQPTHNRQPNFAEVSHWASRHAFRFYCFGDQQGKTSVPQTVSSANHYADELIGACAIFVPDHTRLAQLDTNRKIKLAFISHSIYGYKSLSYEILSGIDLSLANRYIQYNTNKIEGQVPPYTPHKAALTEPAITNFSLPENHKPKQLSIFAGPMDWGFTDKINVVDVGANPIDGTPPYKGLLDRTHINLVGFEPQKEALSKLNTKKGPNETYLPYAVGDGTKKTLYLCQAEGMTSTLEPNFELLNRFQGYPEWAKVKQKLVVDTYRLDDITEVPPIDWLKIDIQGGELAVFKNADEKLKNCLVIQTEVNFIPLYKDQPLFAEIDQWMRAHGFMLHTLLEQRIRLFAPMVINNQVHQGINQLTTADAVYVRSFESLSKMDDSAIIKLACIMHEAYGSYDYAFSLFDFIKDKNKFEKLILNYKKTITGLKPETHQNSTTVDDFSKLLSEHQNSYLRSIGWFESLISRESVTLNGAIPWVTYPFIHFIYKRIKSDFKIFEYGSGNSTLWLSRIAKFVTSVEHDIKWHKKMKPLLPKNVDYIHHDLVYGGDYSKEILKQKYRKKFDIAFIDGRDRVNCIKNSLNAINNKGVIVLDNAEREYYNEGSDFLIEKGFKRIDFIGMGPINIEAWSTAVFYRPQNCLGL